MHSAYEDHRYSIFLLAAWRVLMAGPGAPYRAELWRRSSRAAAIANGVNPETIAEIDTLTSKEAADDI